LPNAILIALNDSVSSRAVLDFLTRLTLSKEDNHITLLHFFREPMSSEELMGKKFAKEQPARYMAVLEKARDQLVESGFDPKKIDIELITEPYATISEGIIDQCKKRHYDMVIIGRKRLSKAEEFVLGDVSIKLIRALEKTAVLVVKSG